MSQKIQTLSGYINEYQRSVHQPEKFWGRIAQSFHWQKPWDNVLSWDFKGPDIKWFENAKLNLSGIFLLMAKKRRLYGNLMIQKKLIE
jgi:acetyl-CoA synthetase